MEGTFDTRKFSNDYVLPSYKEPDYSFGNDIFLKLTLTRSMDIVIGRNSPSEISIYAHVLDISGNEMDRLDLGNADLYISLLPGTYYIVAESIEYGSGKVVDEGLLSLFVNIEEREIGEDFYYPMDLGTLAVSSPFRIRITLQITYLIMSRVPTTMTTIMTWCIASLYSLLSV